MNILWPQFAVAVVLLWLPRQWLRAGVRFFKRRRNKGRSWFPGDRPDLDAGSRDHTIYFRTEFTKFRNYVDFFRASIGGVAIIGGIADIHPAMQAPGDASELHIAMVQWARIAVLLVGVLIQSFRFEKKAAMFPPIFYLTGLTLGLCGIEVAFFAVVLTWAINTVLPGPTAFLSLYALLIGAFGYMLQENIGESVYCAVGLVFLPALISLLAKRRLVHFSKKVKADG